MSDIFREVEEDVRRDRLEKFWKANGPAVIAGVVLLLAAIGFYQGWQRYQTSQREKDSVAFSAAQTIRDPQQAAKAFADLSQKTGGGYAPLSKLEQANNLMLTGQRAPAVAIYKDIAAADQGAVGAVARLRAGWATVDSAPRAELQTLLQPLLDPGSVWKQMAQEILAYSDYSQGKSLVAASEFNKLATDPESPEALRSRARAFATFLAGGGAANFGTVPPPAPATVPGTPPNVPAGAGSR